LYIQRIGFRLFSLIQAYIITSCIHDAFTLQTMSKTAIWFQSNRKQYVALRAAGNWNVQQHQIHDSAHSMADFWYFVKTHTRLL